MRFLKVAVIIRLATGALRSLDYAAAGDKGLRSRAPPPNYQE